LKEWQQLAAQGYAAAQFSLRDMYFEGKGVSADYAKAVMWHRMVTAQSASTPGTITISGPLHRPRRRR
jgi:TPR repeat protein